MHSSDTRQQALSLYPARITAGESVCVYFFHKENLGQPLRGEFRSSLPLPSTNRQLSVLWQERTIPLLRIFVYQLDTTLPS